MRASSIAQVFDRLWPLFHKDPLEVFPAEIMSIVLSHLEPQHLVTASRTSRAWRQRIADSNLWKDKFLCEGWGLDTAELENYERQYNQRRRESAGSPSQISKQSTLFGKQKASPESIAPPYHNYSSALNEVQRWTNLGGEADTGQVQDLREDEEMPDVEVIRPLDPSSDQKSASPVNAGPPSLGFGDDASRLFDPPLPKDPLMIASPSGYHRMNYQHLYSQKRRLEDNWNKGQYRSFQLPSRRYANQAHAECVYTIQYQGNYLVSGSRDRTLRIWDLTHERLVLPPLAGHAGSVLCLQFDSKPDEDIIISGSSDTNIILWQFSTGKLMKRIAHAHKESVLNLRFDHRFLVSCSKDKTIKIWNRNELRPGDTDYPLKGLRDGGNCPAYIIDVPGVTGSICYQPSTPEHKMLLEPYTLLMSLEMHGAAVNAIQIFHDQLVSASGDRNLRMWNIHTGQCTSKVQAHDKGIACVQYDGVRIVSGSSDNSIRIWDPITRTEVARLEGHTRLVRTLQAAFADVPGGKERLAAEAAEIERSWLEARANGEDLRTSRSARPARPGSRRPRDLRSAGAKIPPSGGGSRWSRIISGSYDEKVIIWKKNADDEWIISHQLAQEDALTAAGPPFANRHNHVTVAGPVTQQGAAPAQPLPNPSPPDQTRANAAASGGSTAANPPAAATAGESSQSRTPQPPAQTPLQQPSAMASSSAHAQTQPNPSIPVRDPSGQAPSALHNGSSQLSSQAQADPGPSNPQPPMVPPPAPVLNPSQPVRIQGTTAIIPANALTNPRPPPVPHNGAPPVGQPNARVFKLQFDATRIICCSQDNKIVGWDFANGDDDIRACARFFTDS